MTVGDLIKIFRQERLDQAENYHWSDGEIVGYINDAVQEACERAKLNRDSTTDGIADIEVVAGQSLYPLHRSVFEVDSVTLDNRVLCETSIEELGSAWRTRTGQPSRFVFVPAMGGDPAQIRLFPTPTVGGTAYLTVYRGARRPLRVEACHEVPDIPVRFHRHLLDWVYRCAMLKQDSEVLNVTSAAEHEAIFERNFGKRPDANVQRKHRDVRPPLIASNW